MELIARVGEREQRMRIRRRGDRFEVEVGECAYTVDAARVGGGRWSLILEGAQYEVSVHREPDGGYRVASRGGSQLVELADPLTHLASATRGGSRSQGRRTVKAYMPGRVVAVLAAEGDVVVAGQGVVVLEAMKMENEIRADHAGTLLKIHVAAGQAVEGGDALFEIE